MTNTATDLAPVYIYRTVNGATGDVVAIFPGDDEGAKDAARVAVRSNDLNGETEAVRTFYSERHYL